MADRDPDKLVPGTSSDQTIGRIVSTRGSSTFLRRRLLESLKKIQLEGEVNSAIIYFRPRSPLRFFSPKRDCPPPFFSSPCLFRNR